VRYADMSDEHFKAGLLASGHSKWQANDTALRIGRRPPRTLKQWASEHVASFRS